MEKDIGKLIHKKYNKEDIYIDNNLFISFDDYAIRSNTFQKNVNTTKGRISNQLINANIYCNNTINFNNKINENDSCKRINAIKKCFNLVKNRNELNEILINKCQQEFKDKRNENELNYMNVEQENFDNCVFLIRLVFRNQHDFQFFLKLRNFFLQFSDFFLRQLFEIFIGRGVFQCGLQFA